jgi:hypothetical protein
MHPRTVRTRAARALLVSALFVGAITPTTGSAAPARTMERSVIAVVENSGLNVLHSDFALPPGEEVRFPSKMPKPEWVTLPGTGSFTERIEALSSGPLGNLEPGQLYWIRGTRLGIFVPTASSRQEVISERFHATGTVSSAIGLEHGTNPDALAIYIPDGGEASWEWLASQPWIDAISTSYYTLLSGDASHPTCPEYRSMKKIAEAGRLMFSSSGNFEQAGVANTPSGSPYTYQVGGVDDEGRTYVPGPDRTGQSVTPTRPYETGDRFEFPAADSESLDGSMVFGGTSGATPSTAGRATELLQHARRILGSTWTGVRKGALAIAPKNTGLPERGPLADGRLERDEFIDLLHHSATPAEEPSPFRYLLEGYGALGAEATSLAKRILEGTVEEPQRPDEDTMYEQVETARPLFFPEARCG